MGRIILQNSACLFFYSVHTDLKECQLENLLLQDNIKDKKFSQSRSSFEHPTSLVIICTAPTAFCIRELQIFQMRALTMQANELSF